MRGITRVLYPGALALIIACVCACASDEAKIEKVARRVAKEEAKAAIAEYAKSFAPVKFGFGGALEKEWSHAQGVKTGNILPHWRPSEAWRARPVTYPPLLTVYKNPNQREAGSLMLVSPRVKIEGVVTEISV